jgi:hypothetical protein
MTMRADGWPTVEVPVPDLLGEPVTAMQMRILFTSAGLHLDDGSPLGDWLGAICDAIEHTEPPSEEYEFGDFVRDVFGT